MKDSHNSLKPTWIRIALLISDWTIYGLAILSAIILFIDIFGDIDKIPFIQNNLLTILLIVLATFFSNSVLERKIKIDNIEPNLNDIREEIRSYHNAISLLIEEQKRVPIEIDHFYRSIRRDFPLSDLIEDTTEEIFLIGTTYYHMLDRYEDLIISKSMTCKINFLVMNPLQKFTSLIIGTGKLFGEEESFPEELKKSCKKLLFLKKRILQAGGIMNVRMYSTIPTVNVIMVDPKSSKGTIQVEILPYKGSANMRPGFLLKPNGIKDNLYSLFYTQYMKMWKESDDLTISKYH